MGAQILFLPIVSSLVILLLLLDSWLLFYIAFPIVVALPSIAIVVALKGDEKGKDKPITIALKSEKQLEDQ